MFRHISRVLALLLVIAGFSAGLTLQSGAAPAADGQVAADCVPLQRALTAAEQRLDRAKKKVAKRAAIKQRALKKLKKAKKLAAAEPSKQRKVKVKKAKAAKRKATAKLKKARTKRATAKAVVRSARAALAVCRADQPVVTGPITGGEHGFPGTATNLDLGSVDYEETEYFLCGTATSYERDGAWTSNGEWGVNAVDTAAYQTRLLVRAPRDPADFNGTVLVEWLNVSGNSDADVAFPYMYDEIVREGYAWVGVSAQSVGVNSEGGASTVGDSVMGLKNWDPARYGNLVHPGDEYSYDIFTQAGAALRSAEGVDPLPGMEVEQLIAAGQSQSAYRMATYANAFQPVAGVYDGLIVHSRSGLSAPLGAQGDGPATQGPEGPDAPSPVKLRTDLDVPVLQLLSETELFELGGGAPGTRFVDARQPDTDLLRTWEMAGTAHSDRYLVEIMNEMYLRQFEDARDLSPVFGMINDGPQRHVAAAALRAMQTWITEGTAPTSAGPIQTADGEIVRDEHGNALGGVRTPQVDVPVATLSGETRGIPLNGFTTRFDATQLHDLYGSNEAYVAQFTAAAEEAVEAGFLLEEDADLLIAEAAASGIGDAADD